MIGCVYRSGTPATAIKYDDGLNKTLINMSNLPGFNQKYCFGDFNFNKINWTPQPIPPQDDRVDSQEVKFVECIRDTYMYQHISEPTRYREGQRPTIDDLIFSSDINNVSKIKHLSPLGKSDHEALTCEVQINPPLTQNEKVSYCYDRGDYNQMREMLNIDWNSALEGLDVQESMNKVEALYKEAVERCVPKRQQSTS